MKIFVSNINGFENRRDLIKTHFNELYLDFELTSNQ